MASITIRKLDDATKAGLRQRAARNGRSMEDEVRSILRETAGDPAPPGDFAAPHAATQAAASSDGPRVTLIIGGGIAAYKSLDLIRRLRERGATVRCIMTHAAQQFVTPLAASALSHQRCYADLFDASAEFDVGHIRLARDCEIVVVAPATADLMAKMAQGHADDLASAVLLATDRPILIAPAMNPAMWANPATKRNAAQLLQDGVRFIGPARGEMAEAGEAGTGRMSEPIEIAAAAERLFRQAAGSLAGKRVLITAGPTHEAIDPVRYIANRSSGKQGFAIAEAARDAGAAVALIAGPVALPAPDGIAVTRVESARDMLAAVEAALPADVAIFTAAVADWRTAGEARQKMKKSDKGPPALALTENPDILATIARREQNRPPLVIGFAAETENLLDNARAKIARKGCDWIVANDVSPEGGVMGGDRNTVHLLRRDGGDVSVDSWPIMTKAEVAATLVARIAEAMR